MHGSTTVEEVLMNLQQSITVQMIESENLNREQVFECSNYGLRGLVGHRCGFLDTLKGWHQWTAIRIFFGPLDGQCQYTYQIKSGSTNFWVSTCYAGWESCESITRGNYR